MLDKLIQNFNKGNAWDGCRRNNFQNLIPDGLRGERYCNKPQFEWCLDSKKMKGKYNDQIRDG